MKDFKLIKIFLLIVATVVNNALVADGNLDRSLSTCGRVETAFGVDSTAKAIAIQPDGKMIVAGYSDMSGQNTFALVRYNNDGSLDKSFGDDGIVTTKFGMSEKMSGAHAVVIQSDGKIVAAGFTNALRNTFRWCLARYDVDGTLDVSFCGGRGIIPGTIISTFGGIDDASQAHALALQSDGKIIAAGISVMGDKILFAVARYNRDGSLDARFNKDMNGSIPGVVRTGFGSMDKNDDRAYAVVIQPDGKIVVGGSSHVTGVKTFAMARYLPDGCLDTSFYNPGFSKIHGTVVASFAGGETNAEIRSLLMQPDGYIVAGGCTNSCHMSGDNVHFGIARFMPCGQLDQTFGNDNRAVVPGTIITSFGMREELSKINSMVLQADGKIVAGGFTKVKNDTSFAMARYHKNGAIDFIFNNADSVAGTVRTKFPGSMEDEIHCLALDPNGSLVAVGKTATTIRPHMALARYVCMQQEAMGPSLTYPRCGERIVNGSAINVKGKAQNPSIVSVFLDNKLIDSVYTKTDDWSLTLPSLASGNYSLQAYQIYQGGKVNLVSDMHDFKVDQHPRALEQQFTVNQDCILKENVRASGASGKYTYRLLSSRNGSTSIMDNGAFEFKPATEEGVGSFEFEATDAETQCTGTAKILINIFSLPVVPTIDYITCQDTAFEGNLHNKVIKGLAPYIFTLIDPPNTMLNLNLDGSFYFTPDEGFCGTLSFDYQVMDSRSNMSKPGRIRVDVVQAPIVQDGYYSIGQDTELVSTITHLTTGGKPSYTYHLVEDSVHNGAVNLDKDGSFTFMSSPEFVGDVSFNYTVTDANGCSSKQGTITIQVLEKPVAMDVTFTVVENNVLVQPFAALASKGVAPYVFNVIAWPQSGSLLINADGLLVYNPANDFNGTVSFVYNVTDAQQLVSNNAQVTIVVNQKPKVQPLNVTICQDSALVGSLTSAISEGIAPYTYALVNPNPQLQLNNDGSFVYTPEQSFSGQTSFEYQAIDSLGVASDVGTVSIEVYQKPVIQDDSKQICQETALNDSIAQFASAGLAPYTFSLVSAPLHGTVTMSADGSYTYDPAIGFNGVDSFSYAATDSNNCTSSPATVVVQVLEKPLAADAMFVMLQDTTLTQPLANLITQGTPEYTVTIVQQPIVGSLVLNSDNSFSYTANSGFAGVVTFSYTATDAKNCVSNVAQIIITVNRNPQAQALSVATCQGTPLNGSLVWSVADGVAPYTYHIINADAALDLQLNADGSFVYNPTIDFAGQTNFTYQVTDSLGGVSNEGVVSIQVYERPTAQDDAKILCQDTTLNGTVANLVLGGTAPYKCSLVSEPLNGIVTLNIDGSYTLVPSLGFTGTITFNYVIIDANNCISNHAAVSITVVNKIVVSNPTIIMEQDGQLQGDLNPYITNGDAPYYFAKLSDSNGTATLNQDGTYTFTPNAGFMGIAGFEFEVTNNYNCVSKGIVTIVVQPKPITNDYSQYICPGTVLTGSLLDLISQGTPPYIFSQSGDAINATIQLNNDGLFVLTPMDVTSQASFQYFVTDTHGYVSNVSTVTAFMYDALQAPALSYQVTKNNVLQANLAAEIPDAQNYKFSQIGIAENGNVVIDAHGTFTFIPHANFVGNAQFSYQITDAKGCKASGLVTIQVINPQTIIARTVAERIGTSAQLKKRRMRKYFKR